MDELIDTEMGLVEVEQSDREAAADMFFENVSASNYFSGKMRSGHIDGHWLIQAIAKARIAEREACAKVADAHKPMGYMSDREREYCQDHGQEIADRIRNRTPCTPSPTGVD